MRVLYIAEIVGKAGIYAVKQGLPEVLVHYPADFIIAGADGATGGNGLGRHHAAYLRKLGAQVLTTGECCFYKKDLVEDIEKTPYVLRPYNLNPGAPGLGCRIYNAGNARVGLGVLLGQSWFLRVHARDAVTELPALVDRLKQETPFVIIDFHAVTSAEKKTLFAVADGLCSAVIGSHTRVQTTDEAVLPGGTAVITDAGRTGSIDSVNGVEAQTCIGEYLTGVQDWTKEAWDRLELQGVYIELNEMGRALSIKRIRQPVKECRHE